uniref:Uncharacterized protein AlNc14C208G8870 n=1 Tax=Albugo laibachii Nc14 TaxID=890382 RepID=F0WR62_9STRA|nr:conserved hypothetical protein [Albugo laibachii Nc14]|eukprot:CCA23822.1 conserved hypothetical protein [Albugo laibachii Nc14]
MTLVKALYAALNLLLLIQRDTALLFDLEGGERRCISDQIGDTDLVVVRYNVRTIGFKRGKTGVSMAFQDPSSKLIRTDYDIDTTTEIHVINFHAHESGNYQICFENMRKIKTRILLEFEHGRAAVDYDKKAQEENLDSLTEKFYQLEDLVDEVHADMLYIRDREALMREKNENINSRVLWIGFLSILIFSSLGIGQILYLSKFFKNKKLI